MVTAQTLQCVLKVELCKLLCARKFVSGHHYLIVPRKSLLNSLIMLHPHNTIFSQNFVSKLVETHRTNHANLSFSIRPLDACGWTTHSV